MARLFIAAYPPASVVEALSGLPRSAVDGVRWTNPDQWHVTLRFLGECEVPLALDRFHEVVGVPATARSGRIGRLGRGALVVPIVGLGQLAKSVRSSTEGLGRADGGETFFGHLTLARLRGAPACGLLDHPVEVSWEVNEIALVESVLEATGARHTVIARRALGDTP